MYCLSRDDTETVAAQIRQYTDITASHYHAGEPRLSAAALPGLPMPPAACCLAGQSRALLRLWPPRAPATPRPCTSRTLARSPPRVQA